MGTGGRNVAGRNIGSDEFARYRRAYWALVRRLDLDEDARHGLNERLTGYRSTRRFHETDWRAVVAELQRLSGRPHVRPGVPHLRGERPRRRDYPYPLDSTATPEQVEYIRDLAARVPWRAEDPEAALRTLICRRAWEKRRAAEAEQWLRAGGSLASLPRAVAARAIRILHRMAAVAAH